MKQLIYPHVYLFVYNLKSEPENQEFLDKLTTFPGGFYSPRRLDDTDSLLLACSVEDKKNPSDVSSFPDLRDQLLAQKKKLVNTSNLGKTWILAGYLPRFSYEVDPTTQTRVIEDLAKSAYESLDFGKWDSHPKVGQFMGATVFEIWHSPQNWQDLDAENHHVLIMLYPDLATMEKINNFYEDWRWLFCYRHKILWAYGNTRQIKPVLENNFSPVDVHEDSSKIQPIFSQANLSNYNLTELKISLNKNYGILAIYSEGISGLEVQKQTIETNLHNYKERLKDIEAKAMQLNGTNSTNLDMLKTFSEMVEYKYQFQIERDLSALSPGLRLHDKWIDTVRGIVEIEQAERDRIFQETVEVWGIGLATTAIVATTISPFVPTIRGIKPNDNQTPIDGGINFVLTVAISLIIGWFSKWQAEKWVRSRRHPPTK